MNTPLQITEEIVNPEYRQVIQEKYFACDSDGYLTNVDAVSDELLPALDTLASNTDNQEVVAMAFGLAVFAGWHLGYAQIPDLAQEILESAHNVLSVAPNNSPARLTSRLIQQGALNPVEVRRTLFPEGFPSKNG